MRYYSSDLKASPHRARRSRQFSSLIRVAAFSAHYLFVQVLFAVPFPWISFSRRLSCQQPSKAFSTIRAMNERPRYNSFVATDLEKDNDEFVPWWEHGNYGRHLQARKYQAAVIGRTRLSYNKTQAFSSKSTIPASFRTELDHTMHKLRTSIQQQEKAIRELRAVTPLASHKNLKDQATPADERVVFDADILSDMSCSTIPTPTSDESNSELGGAQSSQDSAEPAAHPSPLQRSSRMTTHAPPLAKTERLPPSTPDFASRVTITLGQGMVADVYSTTSKARERSTDDGESKRESLSTEPRRLDTAWSADAFEKVESTVP